MSWKQSVKADTRYRAFVKRFTDEISTALDIEALTLEIKSLHLTRKVGKLSLATDGLLHNLSEACVQDQANRGRLCQIKLELNEVSNHLTQYLESLVSYLMVRYHDELQDAGYRAKEAKRMAITSLAVFEQAATLSALLDTLWNSCDIVIDDIDKASFALQRLLKAAEIQSQREVRI